MKRFLGLLLALLLGLTAILIPEITQAETPLLQIVYPPPTGHTTVTDRIFFIGTAPPTGIVTVNDQPINRNRVGHFAPSFPLQIGENNFTIRYQKQTRQIKVIRNSIQPTISPELGFAPNSFTPNASIATQSGEPICFSVIASPQATVVIKLANQIIPLTLQPNTPELPALNAALTGRNQPIILPDTNKFVGCGTFTTVDRQLELGKPELQITYNGQTTKKIEAGTVTILSSKYFQVAEVIAKNGVVSRTGPSSDYSHLTPLPPGTRAAITGKFGDWLRLDYGGWINSKTPKPKSVKTTTTSNPDFVPTIKFLPADTTAPQTIIRSIGYRQVADRTEIVFPLQTAVPITTQSGMQSLSITLHNTTAQTDVIRLDDNPIISRLDWQQVAPGKVQYTLHFKKSQQWGYQLRYEGTSLILSLRQPPVLLASSKLPLTGIKILLDPGHGGKGESGASGPDGSLEKDVNLRISLLLREELQKLGATVVMTREDDRELSLEARVEKINQENAMIALSIHYNSLPDDGNLETTQGVSTYWYHAPAQSLAIFMHNYIVKQLNRPSAGTYWNNLALTRPPSTPSVLLELGFIASPNEVEWVTNPTEQSKLAKVIGQGINAWFQKTERLHSQE
jgi:N-acetylmuramoyl-L-alanine amidase